MTFRLVVRRNRSKARSPKHAVALNNLDFRGMTPTRDYDEVFLRVHKITQALGKSLHKMFNFTIFTFSHSHVFIILDIL